MTQPDAGRWEKVQELFGDALALNPGLRDKIQLITKCGIKLKNERFPDRKIKIYDYSKEHIISSVEKSLKNFGTDRIDLLLFHRPAPFFDPEEMVVVMDILNKQGKVLNFGVSNFTPMQFEMLQELTNKELVTNQVEISPYCLEHFENGNIEFFLKNKIYPMAWSPLAGGNIFSPKNKKGRDLMVKISEIAEELNVEYPEEVIYAWILKHPANILPVIGTGKLARIKLAVDALNIDMSLEQWYRIYNASTGEELP